MTTRDPAGPTVPTGPDDLQPPATGPDASGNDLAVGVALGLALGAGIGAALGNAPIGIGAGLALGIAVGSARSRRGR